MGRGLDRLTIEGTGAGLRVAAGLCAKLLPKGFTDIMPGPIASPAVIPDMDGTTDRIAKRYILAQTLTF